MFANPVFDRLTLHSRQPSLRVTVIGGGVLLIGSAAGTAEWMAETPRLLANGASSQFLADALSWGAGPVFIPASQVSTVVTLLCVALIAAAFGMALFLTLREVKSEAFSILQTSTLKPRIMAGGTAMAALFRLRVPLVLTIALIPLTFVSTYQRDFALARYGCLVFVPGETYGKVDIDHVTGPCAAADDARVGWLWLGDVPGKIAVLGTVVLAAALGASLTLWLRNGWLVVGGMVGAALVAVVVLTLIGPGMGPVTGICLDSCKMMAVWPPADFAQNIFWALVPFALAWAAIRLARVRPAK